MKAMLTVKIIYAFVIKCAPAWPLPLATCQLPLPQASGSTPIAAPSWLFTSQQEDKRH